MRSVAKRCPAQATGSTSRCRRSTAFSCGDPMTDTGLGTSPVGHRLGLLAPSFMLVGIMLGGPLALMGLFSVWRFVPGKITDYSLTLSNYGRLLGDGFYL